MFRHHEAHVRTRLSQFLVVCALVGVIGGHWAILQSVAWVGMAVKYSQNSTLKEALIKTFDGQHPCQLCKVVQAGKHSEKKRTLLKVEMKLDFWMAGNVSLIDPPPALPVFAAQSEAVPNRLDTPPTPPPRVA